ncbi:hypothetical protein ACVZHT_39060, partial [Vibrio diabolicus]
ENAVLGLFVGRFHLALECAKAPAIASDISLTLSTHTFKDYQQGFVMNDFKDLASFAGFSGLTGLSFGTIFFSLAFVYSS